MLNGKQFSVVDDETDAVVIADDLLLMNVPRARPADVPRSIRAAVVLEVSLENQDHLIARMSVPHRRRTRLSPDEASPDSANRILGNNMEPQAGTDLRPGRPSSRPDGEALRAGP